MQVTLMPRGTGSWADVHVTGSPDIEDGPVAKVYLNDYRKRDVSVRRLALAQVIRSAVENALLRKEDQ